MNNRRFNNRRRRFPTRQRSCQFCTENVTTIDYKDVDLLRRHVSDRGKIRPRRQTHLCAKHQRLMTAAIKRARHIALLPFVAEVNYRER